MDSTFIDATAGLVMITPSTGFVDIGARFFFGVAGRGICRLELRIKFSKMAKRFRWVCWGGCYGVVCAEGCGVRWDYRDTGRMYFDGNWGQIGVQVLEAVVGFV